MNDGKVGYTIGRAEAMMEALPNAPVACLGLAFKANIDDFRESPALHVALELAKRHGSRLRVVEPYANTLPESFSGTGAQLVDIDTALETCPIMIVLVDHDVFRSVPLAERADKLVSDDEIVQRAREEARIIRNEAKMDADEMKLKVTHEALQMLAGVEDELAEALNAVRRNRKQLDDDAQ